MAYRKAIRRVSIAMGIYNCADTIAEAVDSIINQTFTDWELIMCDDGSSDRTYLLAKEYENKYENILVLKNGFNLGLPATLNKCIERANGEYIARMDGDDISMPERLQIEVDFLDTHSEFSIVSCSMVTFDKNGDWGCKINKSEPTKYDFIKSSPFCHAPSMMRKKDLNAIGNYTVRPDIRRGQDYFLWHKFYLNGMKGYNLSEPLYKMRDDKDAAKRRGFNTSYINRLKSSISNAKVRHEVLLDLELPFIYRCFCVRPIIVSLLPYFIYKWAHKVKMK